jgi:hypothetical protein
MDEVPFLKINLLNLTNYDINDIKKLHKNIFNIDEIINSAINSKYSNKLFEFFNKEFNNPSDEFIKCIISNFYTGRITSKITEKFKSIFTKTIDSYINNIISKRLNLNYLTLLC